MMVLQFLYIVYATQVQWVQDINYSFFMLSELCTVENNSYLSSAYFLCDYTVQIVYSTSYRTRTLYRYSVE